MPDTGRRQKRRRRWRRTTSRGWCAGGSSSFGDGVDGGMRRDVPGGEDDQRNRQDGSSDRAQDRHLRGLQKRSPQSRQVVGERWTQRSFVAGTISLINWKNRSASRMMVQRLNSVVRALRAYAAATMSPATSQSSLSLRSWAGAGRGRLCVGGRRHVYRHLRFPVEGDGVPEVPRPFPITLPRGFRRAHRSSQYHPSSP